MGKQFALNEEIIWLEKALVCSGVMSVRMNGRNPMDPEDQPVARNVAVRISTELQVIEDAREKADGGEETGNVYRTRLSIPCTGEDDGLELLVSAAYYDRATYSAVPQIVL
jgi:hypothetical protein